MIVFKLLAVLVLLLVGCSAGSAAFDYFAFGGLKGGFVSNALVAIAYLAVMVGCVLGIYQVLAFKETK